MRRGRWRIEGGICHFVIPKRRLANLNLRNGLRTGNRVRCEAALRGTHSQAALGNDRNKPAMAKMRELCRSRLEAFGCGGMAERLTPLPLPAMAERYAEGGLAH